MIIDSHAHYTHGCFQNTFRYIRTDGERYTIEEGDRETLLEDLAREGIGCAIEPGINLASCREILRFCAEKPDRFFPAVGVHPTRTFLEQWQDRRELETLSKAPGVIAIGETGLDYHYKREDQHRRIQYLWFLYQLDLAWRRKLPVILHVRDAHADALRILRLHPARKLGGVIHCFHDSWDVAKQYLDLGYHIGIGGALLQPEEKVELFWEAVKNIPMERILIETDAPFILPWCRDQYDRKELKKVRNTSLILPNVIRKIAQLKGLEPEEVERITGENVIRLFRLPVKTE